MKEEGPVRKVLVFGVFDGIHDGHRYFLREAKKRGTHVTVVVAPDGAVLELKEQKPSRTLAERMRDVDALGIADRVIPGDTEANSWGVITREEPAVIVLGYDQKNLKDALMAARDMLPSIEELCEIDSFEGDRLHSSILKKKNAK